MGGAGTGSSFFANIDSLAAIRIRMSTIHDAVDPDTSCTFLGYKLSLPVLAAPIGGVSFNMSKSVSESEYIESMVNGSADAGTMACTGDGEQDLIHEEGCRAISARSGAGIPFIKPWRSEEILRKAQIAADAGAGAMGMDIDASGLITLRLFGKPVFPKPVSELRSIIKAAGLPVILKGIMTVEEAERAAEAGAAAIVVSNHGGRVLDSTPGTAEVLPVIAEAVGDRLSILVDGGIRSGIDVFKMLALGADAVLIGRPLAISAIGGKAEGVSAYLESIRQELYKTMMMTGCASLADITMDRLQP
jgi:isopentenyl diphosphate isomerase/L-lactate dehydrogenase-like FMN-dependent dehydrogenase